MSLYTSVLLWLLIIVVINYCYWLLLLLLLSLPCRFKAYYKEFLANKLFPEWIFKKVTDMIIQNASGTFDPWQHTGIQSVLFHISKLPKRAEEGDGQWGTYPFLITHWGDSAIMNVVQTGEFWHQKKGLRRQWAFWSLWVPASWWADWKASQPETEPWYGV